MLHHYLFLLLYITLPRQPLKAVLFFSINIRDLIQNEVIQLGSNKDRNPNINAHTD